MHAGVNLHAKARVAFLGLAEQIERDGAVAELDARPAQTDLLEEEQIVVGEARAQAVGDPGVAGIVFRDGADGTESGESGRGQCEEVSAAHRVLTSWESSPWRPYRRTRPWLRSCHRPPI